MRVRIDVAEPFDLVSGSDDVVVIVGDVEPEESPSYIAVRPISGSRLAGETISRVVLRPRHVGRSVSDLADGQPLVVNGEAYSPSAKTGLEFIGTVSIMRR